jgi:hypothetical protein
MYAKKTFYNYMYKEITNSIYGQIAMGIGGKNTFDVKTKSYIKVNGSFLSSPILASYITGFVRALIGECLNNIQLLGGKVISVTTDGFITDIEDLENKILTLDLPNKRCLMLYRLIRKNLTSTKTESGLVFNDSALEVKCTETVGIISFKTRGQIGLSGTITATTGFQHRRIDRTFLEKTFIDIIENSSSSDKVFEFIQTGLRSAKDVYDYGGHLISTYKDKSFSLEYDNKRCVIDSKIKDGIKDTIP